MSNSSLSIVSALPQRWQNAAEFQLKSHEVVITHLEIDLRPDHHFGQSLLLVTDRRILEFRENRAPNEPAIQWELPEKAKFTNTLLSGLGRLELWSDDRISTIWPYTAAREAMVDRFVAATTAAFIHRTSSRDGLEHETTRCVTCGAILSLDQPVCLACKPAAAPSPSQSLWRLAPFARRRMKTTIVGILLTVAATIVGLIPPYMTKPLLDEVLIPWQNDKLVSNSLVVGYLSALTIAAVLAWILSWAKIYVLALASEQISADLRNETYSHLHRLSLEFYGGRRTGDFISRISSDTERICNFLSVHVVDFVSDIFMFAFTAVVLLMIDPMLAAVTLLPFPLIAWLVYQVRIRLRHGFARSANAWSEMVSVLTDAIPGVRVVKAFAQEKREIERFEETNQSVLQSNVRVNRLWAFFGPTVTLLTEIGVLIIWAFGAWRVSTGDVQVGVLVSFLAYISRFYTRLDSVSRMLANTQRAAAATYRVFEILDRKSAVMEPAKPVHPGRLRGGLIIRDLRFKYGAREVLRGVNLEIQPGELIGLVGSSGSGKSTLVNLVCRFYDATQGEILADGTDIRSFPVEEYRRNIGIVLQDPFLFYGTIAENIAYGRPEAPRQEIISAARAAHAHAFIMRLPDGYDSLVGERGQSLSGGERQRISIARALLTDPRVLILDEATSAVDNETEREIQIALDNLIRGRTTIAIAHRLSTLRHANRIVVLDAGQVTEVGTHEELLQSGGIYQRLYYAQRELIEPNPVTL